MIFEVSPSQIEALDSRTLVELLRKLLHAEAQRAGINLRGVSVPLQISVSDGGEDARIWWDGGVERTDYCPARFSVFQAKATDPGPAGWKKEVWAKSTQNATAIRRPTEAIAKALSQRGAYIGFTSAALVGSRYDRRVQGIMDGIAETGANPNDLAAIDIYDANKISAWASQHPPIAVWINERQTGLALGGFQTTEGWGRKNDFLSIQHVDDNAPRYSFGYRNSSNVESRQPHGQNALPFQQAKERLLDHLTQESNCVRLVGPSGIGKTRFAFELFKDTSTVTKITNAIATIYCDYRNVGPQILNTLDTLAAMGSSALIIVDECDRQTAKQLGEIVRQTNSKLRLLTIDIDDSPVVGPNWLNIFVGPSDEALVEGIVRQKLKNADSAELSYIISLCGGYPRIAVLAASSYTNDEPVLKSVSDVAERILLGSGINNDDQVRAIECLALFQRLGADGDYGDQFDLVAEKLAGLSGDRMYEHIVRASQHYLVERRGRFFLAQPMPIAGFIGSRRLDLLRSKTILEFIRQAPKTLVEDFLKQWKLFDTSKMANVLAELLLARDGLFGSFDTIDTEYGSMCLDCLVHVAPDVAAETLHREFGGISVDQLKEVRAGRRSLVWALEKLVFRKRSFAASARLLMKLAAAENETWSNNASGLFKQLFQVHLSGTEVTPAERFSILDEGLASTDDRVAGICIEALSNTLTRDHFTRVSGGDQIGSQPPIKDWRAETWGELFDFHRNGLRRLLEQRKKGGSVAIRCEIVIASNIRGLISENLFDDVASTITKIADDKAIWLEAIEAIGDWLYFDRNAASRELSAKVRALYDALMPKDLIQKAVLYTKFWPTDIRNPDLIYNKGTSSNNDFEYSSRKARELATEIAADNSLIAKAIQTMVSEDLNNSFPFAHELALKVEDPISAFRIAVEEYELSKSRTGSQFIQGMLRGIDQRDPGAADICMDIALNSEVLKGQAINIYRAVSITAERLDEILRALKENKISASDCVLLSYGRGLDLLEPQSLLPLLNELASNHDADGIWTALEIVSMYQHGRAAFDARLENFVKANLTSPKILTEVRRANGDGYLFESFVQVIQSKGKLDDDFAFALCEQIVRLCQTTHHEVFFALDEPFRKIIRLLVEVKPGPLWLSISRFFELATPNEQHWLESLIGPSRNGFDGNGHNAAGNLFGVPETPIFEWVHMDPPNRAKFLCIFYPILASTDTADGLRQDWHPSLEKIAAEFGSFPGFRNALGRRLHPSSWSGSLVPHLEVYLSPLEKWFAHPILGLSLWARETYHFLERQIRAEKQHDEEDT